MCVSPIYVKNVNYVPNGNKALGDLPIFAENTSLYSRLKSTLAYIPVPCGHCSQCLANRQMEVVQRARIAYNHSHCYMVTLTYKDAMIPQIETTAGYKLRYADISDVQRMLKRIRKILPPFKYICASEYGGKRHRPHFHMIFFFDKRKDDTMFYPIKLEMELDKAIRVNWCRNMSASTRHPRYESLCEFISRGGRSTYDCHYISETNGNSSDPSDVAFYVTKYCLKIDNWVKSLKSALYLNYDNWKEYWQVVRPRLLISKGLGFKSPTSALVYDDLQEQFSSWIQFAKVNKSDSGPLFVLANGQTQPLSKYFKNKFLTYEDAVFFADRMRNRLIPEGQSQSLDNTIESQTHTPLEMQNIFSRELQFELTRVRLGVDNDDLDYFEISDNNVIFDPVKHLKHSKYVEQNQTSASAAISPCTTFDDLCNVADSPCEVVQQQPRNCSDERNPYEHVAETGKFAVEFGF